MKIPKVLKNKHEFNNEYIFFHIVHSLGQLITWSYFVILLLRTTESPIDAVPLVVFYHLLLYSGLIIGFLINGKIISSIGYLNAYRLANVIQMLTTVLALLLLDQIGETYIFISLIIGIGRGLFWNTTHMFNSVEMNLADRSKLINLMYSINQLLGVVMPILIGGVITYIGYPIVFVVGILLYLMSIVYPWKYNKVPRDKLSIADFKSISRRPGFHKWSVFMMLEGFMASSRVMALGVVPFLFIGDEFGVGVLGSAVGLMGAMLAFIHRNDEIKHKFKLGAIGAAIVYIFTLGLLAFWNLAALIVRSVMAQLGFAFYAPAHSNYDYRIRELIMGDFKNQLGIEMQQYAELFLYSGRILSVAVFLVGLYVLSIEMEILLMILIGISLLREPIIMMYSAYILKSLQRGTSKPLPHSHHQSHSPLSTH